MVDDERRRAWLSATAASCAGLSIVGSAYILGRYWYVRSWKTRKGAVRRRVDVTQELIHVLAWFDLLGALGRAFGHLPARSFDQSKGEPVTVVCELQAFAISFSDTSAIMWNFLMALNLYRWVCLGEDQQRLTRTIKYYTIGTLMFASTITAMALGFGVYGDATIWCWITMPDDPTSELYWKLGSLYIWIIALAIAMAVLLVLVKMNVRRRLEGVDNADARIAYKSVVQTLTIYIVAFIVCWTPPVVNRIYTWSNGTHDFTLQMLHVSIISVQGFVNAVIYGKFHVWLMRRILCIRHQGERRSSLKPTKSIEETLPRTGLDRRFNHLQVGIASIFVTTFDMNWAPLPSTLNDWIPAAKDVYVFNLQHCMGIQLVEQAIREYLMRVNFPMGYRSITSVAGSMVRGDLEDASICQMIFVNNSDVVSGNFQCKTEDRRQWAQWKSNRDVVGVPIRYFDSAIAFVSCNLDSGSGSPAVPGRPQPKPSMQSKIATTASLLRSFSMGADRSTVEFPHLYHHTFLSGNFNFRIAQPHAELMATIDRAYKAECLKRATDTATQAKLQSREAQPKGFSTHADYTVNTARDASIRFSHARTSATSQATEDDETEYGVLYTSNDDGLSFTELQSPCQSNRNREDADHSEIAITIHASQDRQRGSGAGSHSAWLSFLDRILPTTSPLPNDRPLRLGTLTKSSKESFSPMPSPHNRQRAMGASLARSRMTAEYSHTNWQDLTQHDELRGAMEAREVLAGFEEPAIGFLPSYPRRTGVSAPFLMRSETSTKEFYCDVTEGEPAYVDRVLLHSLPDTRKRIRNVAYWCCEEVTTSIHKPVCSVYELEVDRFFAYKSNEARVTDVQAGNLALRDKTDIHEFKVKLINLDVNMWTYQPIQRQSMMNPLRRLRSPSLDAGQVYSNLSLGSSPTLGSDASSRRAISTRLLESRSQAALSGGSALSQRGRRDSLDSPQVELVPVEPTKISTVFPLPSEDVYALQRKVYEVAHAVQKGFLSTSRDGESEEASLAYTNSRTVSWRDATSHGVSHSAIMKPVNGVLHVAIHVDSGMKGQGGQGILCIDQPDLFTSSGDGENQEERRPIPFDIPLTWGGKHVGYLHGEIVSGFQ